MSETRPTGQHRHRTHTSREECYSCPVAWPERPEAHGNICVVSTCRCGATRHVNVNGAWAEIGKWTPTEEERSAGR